MINLSNLNLTLPLRLIIIGSILSIEGLIRSNSNLMSSIQQKFGQNINLSQNELINKLSNILHKPQVPSYNTLFNLDLDLDLNFDRELKNSD